MKVIHTILRLIGRSKYVIVIIIGSLIVVFLDENSFVKRMEYNTQISDLRAEIRKFSDQFKRDSAVVLRLKTDPKSIRDIARERYLMKEDDEEIFVLSDDKANS